MTRCVNCEAPLDINFCPKCGQKNIELERPITELLSDLVRETLDVDGRAIQTLWTMFRRPGVLTSEFLAGRRRRFSPPLRTYLVISVLFFVVTAWVAGQGILLSGDEAQEDIALGQARLFSDYVPKLMFILLPVFALLLKVAYRHRLYFHHLIHSLHIHSAAFVVLAFILPLERAAGTVKLAMVVQSLLFAYLLASFVISLHHVYRAGWLVTFGKALGILLVYSILIGGSLEIASHFTMPDASAWQILTD